MKSKLENRDLQIRPLLGENISLFFQFFLGTYILCQVSCLYICFQTINGPFFTNNMTETACRTPLNQHPGLFLILNSASISVSAIGTNNCVSDGYECQLLVAKSGIVSPNNPLTLLPGDVTLDHVLTKFWRIKKPLEMYFLLRQVSKRVSENPHSTVCPNNENLMPK